MKTLQRFLIVLAVFVFAYNASTIVHELGHALALVSTGGEVASIKVSPLSWSYTGIASNPEPMATSWAGYLWETVIGLLVFFVLWVTRSRLSLIGVVFAMASLGATGIYMAVGALVDIGDSADLMEMGIPQGVLATIGVVLLLLVFPLVLPLGGLLGVGRGRNSLGVTALVFSPIVLYLLAMLGFNLWRNPDEWMMWTAAVGGGILIVLLTSVVVHYSSQWCAGPETQRRALPINWRTCILSLALGGGVIAAESVFFASS